MGVAITFMANAVRLFACSSIHDCPGDSDALLFHDKAQRVVNVVPQARITLRFRRLRRGRRSWGSGRWCRRHRESHVLRPDPTDLFILRPNVIEATGWGFIH